MYKRQSLLKPTHHRTIPRTTDAGRTRETRSNRINPRGSIDPSSRRSRPDVASRGGASSVTRSSTRVPSSSRASLPNVHTVPPRASSIIRVPSNHPRYDRARYDRSHACMGSSERMTRRHRVESVERRTRPWKRCARRREPSSFVRSFVRSFDRSRVDMTTDRTVMRPGR